MGKPKDKKRPREPEDDGTTANAGGPAETSEAQQKPNPSKKARIEKNKSLFVRSLPPTATSESLAEFFSQHFPVKHSVVVLDPTTKTSRGYGFVTFTDPADAAAAKERLGSEQFEGRRLKLDWAEPRVRTAGVDAEDPSSLSRKRKSAGPRPIHAAVAAEKDKRREELEEARRPLKLIVRNLPWSVKTSEDLEAIFRPYGKVRFADLPRKKDGKQLAGFGFVTLKRRKNAEKAMEAVNGRELDGRTVVVDWAVEKTVWDQQQDQEDEKKDEVADDDGEEPAKKKRKQKKEKKAESPPKEDGEDQDKPMDEEDADLAAFMEKMQDMESEDEDGDDQQDSENDATDADQDGDDQGGEASEDDEDEAWADESDTPKQKQLQTDNSTTLFVRNLPYTMTDEQLKTHFDQFGWVRYARVVMNRVTSQCAGTGFVCFSKLEDSQACLKGGPRKRPATTLSKHSVLQDEKVDPDGRYTLDGRVLQVAQAVSKDEATRLAESGQAGRAKQDKRRLYLLSEGTIPKNSGLYGLLSPAEIKMREASEQQRKKLIKSNPSLHISLTRLAVRNLPRNIGSKELKALAREAVVGFATDVKAGRRKPLSKEEVARAGASNNEAEKRRKERAQGLVHQAKVVFETTQGSKVAETSGAGKSRGYGFIEFWSHRWALMGLRWLNGHAVKNEATGKTQRLIVEFAIENANVVQRRRTREEKSRADRRPPGQKKEKKDGAGEKPEGGGETKEAPMRKKGKKVAKWETKGGKKFKKESGDGTAVKLSRKQKAAAAAVGAKDETAKRGDAAQAALQTKVVARKRATRKKKAELRSKK